MKNTYKPNAYDVVMASDNDSYEIKIGNTVYVVSHEYGDSDLSEIITDYLSDKAEEINI